MSIQGSQRHVPPPLLRLIQRGPVDRITGYIPEAFRPTAILPTGITLYDFAMEKGAPEVQEYITGVLTAEERAHFGLSNDSPSTGDEDDSLTNIYGADLFDDLFDDDSGSEVILQTTSAETREREYQLQSELQLASQERAKSHEDTDEISQSLDAILNEYRSSGALTLHELATDTSSSNERVSFPTPVVAPRQPAPTERKKRPRAHEPADWTSGPKASHSKFRSTTSLSATTRISSPVSRSAPATTLHSSPQRQVDAPQRPRSLSALLSLDAAEITASKLSRTPTSIADALVILASADRIHESDLLWIEREINASQLSVAAKDALDRVSPTTSFFPAHPVRPYN